MIVTISTFRPSTEVVRSDLAYDTCARIESPWLVRSRNLASTRSSIAPTSPYENGNESAKKTDASESNLCLNETRNAPSRPVRALTASRTCLYARMWNFSHEPLAPSVPGTRSGPPSDDPDVACAR